MVALLQLMPAFDDAMQNASNSEMQQEVSFFADAYDQLDKARCGRAEMPEATLEDLLLRSIDVLEMCQDERNEQIKMGKLYEAIGSDLASLNKSWNDIHELLTAKLYELGAI